MLFDRLYVLGDQSLDILPSIRKLSARCRQDIVLNEFMRSAIDNIQHALTATPAHIRPKVAPFDSALQLAEAVETAAGSTPLVSSLLAVVQLGEFIVHLSSEPCALDQSQSLSTFLGICTGSLSAAAIASSRNLTELLQIAPHIVSLAFYVGLEALIRTQSLEASEGSWAIVIKDFDPEELQTILDEFNRSLGNYCHKRSYISAVGESSVTVSGPPSILRRLFSETVSLRHTRRLQLPIKAAFHARHLVPISHSKLFQNVDSRQFRRRLHSRVISPCSGTWYASWRLDCVLHEVVDEILQQHIDWRIATKDLPTLLKPSASAVPIGPFVATSGLSKWLLHKSEIEVEDQHIRQILRPAREGSAAIAIVGMSIRAPGSETLEEFWDVLTAGKDLHERIPADRFDVDEYRDISGKNKNAMPTPYGVFVDRPGFFDPRFFNMSPREAYQTDPQQRLVLLTTYEALENAGYRPNRTPSSNTRRIASFVGQTGDDYREHNANQDVDTYFITGNIRAFGPGRLNYHFGWEGPSFSVDTACSSSGASIQLACSSLLSRECDMAVSGGANLLTSPELFAGLSRGGFLSNTGGCKTFDRDADGYVRGEGCGIVVLKRLEDAMSDRDNILAVIRGATTNHSAEAVSITHPHEETQERLFKAVLSDANVLPHEVDLAEIHGTGTQAGDTTESRSVTNVLCQGRTSENLLTLSTVKPNVGHSEAASGVTSIIKAVMMMQKNVIPPHIGIKGFINGKLPRLNDINARVCLEESIFCPRPNGDGKRRILVNNFDAAGGNTSMLIEDPPRLDVTGKDQRSHKVVAMSAKTPTALSNNTRNMLHWLKTNPKASLDDIAYTSTSRRIHHLHRKAYTAATTKELIEQLEKQSHIEHVRRPPVQPGVVFCFTGQGSQYLSMASALYETHSAFRETIRHYDELCSSHGLPSFLPIIAGDSKAFESPVRTQLSIVAIELALAVLWNSWGVKASAVVGHSLGEYAALCHSGVISVSDCLYLVGRRAELIAETCTADTHAMLAVQASSSIIQETLEDACIKKLEYACLNSPRSTVMSGPLTEIEQLNEMLKLKGLSTRILPTRYAFHSSQLDVALDKFQIIAQKVDYNAPSVPIASTMLGEVVSAIGRFDSQYMKIQTRDPVRFQEAIEALYSASLVNEASVWIEIGPAPTCLSMIKATALGARATLPSLQNCRADWQVLSSSLCSAYTAGLEIDWIEVNRPFEQSLRLVQLPNYSFDLKNYWMYEGDTVTPLHSRRQSDLQKFESIEGVPFNATESLHRVEKEEINAEGLLVTFTTDTTKPSFNKVLRGHVVNGLALCPSSVYADMTMTAASYVRSLSKQTQSLLTEVADMEVMKPLIINDNDEGQIIRLTARRIQFSNDISIEIGSQDGNDHQLHATCIVHLVKGNDHMVDASRNAYLIHNRIAQLRQASIDGQVHRILRPMVYKLFKSLVDYDDEYQGLEEVYLNTSMLEAAANVTFRTGGDGFACNPYWIDSIAHLSGFVLNGTEFTPADSVFISHGWKSLQIASSLSSEKTYQSYVRMQVSTPNTVFAGDVYLFDGDNVVAICHGLKFQQVKRNILDHILPPAKKSLAISRVSESAHNVPSSLCSKNLPSKSLNFQPHNTLNEDGRPITTKLDHVLAIIATELGLEVSELDDDLEFAHLGVDSLMTTQLIGKIGAQTGICFPASVISDCMNIKGLREALSCDNITAPQYTLFSTAALRDQNSVTTQPMGFRPQDILGRVLEAIAHELRIHPSEMDDDASFVDLGVDSLLTVGLLSSISEITGEQLPASLFVECPTVADLRRHLQRDRCSDQSTTATDTNAFCCQSDCDNVSLGQLTPATELGDSSEECCLVEKSVTTEVLRKIVAEEIGICTTEIDNNALLCDMGVDSLLSLSILTRIKQQTGMSLASKFLVENPTFSAIERALSDTPTHQRARGTPPIRSSTDSLPTLSTSAQPRIYSADISSTKTWTASSILLQGSSYCMEPCIFLIPDGSGSPSSYIGLSDLGHAGAVYGLVSPFLAEPESFTLSLQDLVALYITEMIRIQPRGPYLIGGWSFGGICAFEAASQLIRIHGQRVSSLVLIDAPCPTILPPLPIEDVDFLQSIGAFETLRLSSKPTAGAAATSTTLGLHNGIREHFAGTLNALEQYKAGAIDDVKAPDKVIILWARHGVRETLDGGMGIFTSEKKQNSQQHPTTDWLMETRASYGTCGWEELLPGSNFTCHTIQGDHFSMMRKPGALELGPKIRSLFG